MRTHVLLLVAAALPFAGIRAQDLRTLETARQLTSTKPLQVDVAFAAGKFSLHPLEGALLYDMRLRYDERTSDAVHEYDASAGTLSLGLSRASAKFGVRALRGGGHDKSSELDLGLNGAVPMALDVKLAGTESTLELGGLQLTNLVLNCAATGATINFDSPNRAKMEMLELQIAGAGAKIENLGNANAANVRIQGAAGGLDIDFGDVVMRDMTLTSEVALGGLQLTLPRDVGLLVRAKTRLGNFDGSGLKKVGDAWYSENWNEASIKVTIESTTVIGSLELSRTGR